MTVLGVIPARGGSRRIPRKNVKSLLGIPLIGFMCRAALASKIDRVILSTDDDEIADAAARFGVPAPFRRPPDLAEDVPSEFVTLHALDWAAKAFGESYDFVVTLQPTTPFVLPEHIDACIEMAREPGTGSCITARRASQPPQWMFTLGDKGLAEPMMAGEVKGERGVFQSLPPCYLPSGAAYATRVSALVEQQKLIATPTRLVIMDDARSVDIDEPIDWVVAEAVGKHYGFGVVEAVDCAVRSQGPEPVLKK